VSGPTIRGNLAVQDAGFEPAGIVVGAATYQIVRPGGCRYGWGATKSAPFLEYSAYGQTVTRVWQEAIAAIEADARGRHAHGVAGVSVAEEWFAGSAYQVRLIGNAVVVRDVRPLPRPFLSTLSMEQTLKLVLRGWVPSGIGVGVAAVHVHGVHTSGFRQGAATRNIEMPVPTEAMQYVRRQIETRLRRSPTLRHAEGVIAADTQLSYETEGCARVGPGIGLVGRMIGTGVVRFGAPTVAIDVAVSVAKGEDDDG
jgi:hypothetical protein